MGSRASTTLLLALALAVACEEPEPEALVLDDLVDRCATIPLGCLEGHRPDEDDGCPAPSPPEIAFAPGSATLDEPGERVLEGLWQDAVHLGPGVTLRLVAVGDADPALATARIDTVRAGLVARTVPVGRITRGGDAPTGFVTEGVRIAIDGCPPPK